MIPTLGVAGKAAAIVVVLCVNLISRMVRLIGGLSGFKDYFRVSGVTHFF